ncbi:MAG: DNA modification methylase [Oscillospiraceae bacterium]|nr:DNA modification methylase [Oscillospiraceae bacterium]
MEIQKIPAARLNPAAYNPRVDLKPGDKEYEKLKRSINEFGYVEPVIWNRQTGNVVGGHQRLKVLLDMGQTEIDCVVVDLDLSHEKALNIALNKIQGDWDEDKLAAIMADFDAEAFDVSLTGFDAGEVDALLNRFYSHEAVEDDFDAGAEKKKIQDAGGPESRPGDVWQLGDHILICGDPADASVYDRLLGSERAQCVVTSPPIDPGAYARDGIAPWLDRMAGIIRLLAAHADIICWQTGDIAKTGSQFIEPMAVHSVSLFADQNLRPLWIRVWKMTGNIPTASALQNSSNKPVPQYDFLAAFAGDETEGYNDQEYTWVSAFASHAFQFVRRLTKEERRKWGYAGVWEISVMKRDKDAEAMIPVELPWRCLKMHSDLRASVLDPFAGLGSTLIACEQSGRRCRAIESDPLHCDLIRRRWEQFTGEKAEKI